MRGSRSKRVADVRLGSCLQEVGRGPVLEMCDWENALYALLYESSIREFLYDSCSEAPGYLLHPLKALTGLDRTPEIGRPPLF